MTKASISIGLIEFDSEQYIESVALRQRVLRDPLGLKFTKENMVNDANEYHLAATDGTEIIGILLLRPLENQAIKMRQVAVAPELQGQGVGKALVLESELLAKNLGFKHMELHARKVALAFYQSLNYEVIGPEFLEIGIPHVKMVKDL